MTSAASTAPITASCAARAGSRRWRRLRELKLRGEQVAVILADYRMPQMNGIEFLEQAMDIFPYARRVLLTAYADTEAAIQAINLVDVDHYLLKPWDPPEEKLYPVVSELLEVWKASAHAPVPETKVIGHRWSARSFEVRDFLARNRVPYRWYAATEPEGERLLAAAGRPREDCIPVVITPDGQVLSSPSDAELASRVGLSTDPAEDFLRRHRGGRRARPGSEPLSTRHRRACARSWSSAPPPAARPGRAHASRTTSASPTASPAHSWPSGPDGRRSSSVPRSSAHET